MSLPNFTTIKESTERMDKNQCAVRDGDAERSGSRKVGKCSFNARREGRPHGQLRVLSEFPSLWWCLLQSGWLAEEGNEEKNKSRKQKHGPGAGAKAIIHRFPSSCFPVCFLAAPRSQQDLSSPTRDPPRALGSGAELLNPGSGHWRQSPNLRAARGVPVYAIFKRISNLQKSCENEWTHLAFT